MHKNVVAQIRKATRKKYSTEDWYVLQSSYGQVN